MTYDVVIVGAGPAGLSFARTLSNTGLRIAIVDKQSEPQLASPEFDGRDIALTHLSVRILKELGTWARFKSDEIAPIRNASVMDGTSPHTLNFDCEKTSSRVLGFIVPNHVIRKALFDEVRLFENVTFIPDQAVTSVATSESHASVDLADGRALKSQLVVAADSRFSETRRMLGISAAMHDFGRACIVSRMHHQHPHNGTAFECFHYGRTLAVLPLTSHQSSIVVTAPTDQCNRIMAMDEAQFACDIRDRFNRRYGDMKPASARYTYPLVGVHATKFYAKRFALIGDAAVGMHPVTAHGYNLGLSGQEILGTEIAKAAAQQNDIGATALLRTYQRHHMRSTKPMFHGTNEIVKFFTDDRLPAKLARKIAIRLANNLPPIRRAIQNKLTETTNRPAFLSPLFRMN